MRFVVHESVMRMLCIAHLLFQAFCYYASAKHYIMHNCKFEVNRKVKLSKASCYQKADSVESICVSYIP